MKCVIQLFSVVCLALGLCVGCDSATVKGPDGAKLKLVKPMDQTLERGKTNEVDVKIDREALPGPVAIVLSQLPAGVKVADGKTEITGTDESTTVTLHADPAAALVTDHRVIVTAKAGSLEVAEGFNLTVK